VNPAAQRQGVGRALVQWGIEHAAEDKLPIYLAASREGEGLYTATGFVKRVERAFGGREELTALMVKDSMTGP
jgi:predicted N-acetyltransferase YhbS